MNAKSTPQEAFFNKEYLTSREGRIIRVLSEFSEPKHRFEKQGIEDTIVFFGSARTLPTKTAKSNLKKIKAQKRVPATKLKQAERDLVMSKYYEDAKELSRRLSLWLKKRTNTFAMCSGGGPGIMEAMNKGAHLAKFPSVGLNINLPFEQSPNPFISSELNFEFHYFFLRKFWFVYLAKALVVFPGGFGTLDEMMEVFTLVQTKKIQKNLQMIVFGEEYWKNVINFDFLADSLVVDKQDLQLFDFCNTVDEAFTSITDHFKKHYLNNGIKKG